MTRKCQNCGAAISDDPQWDLEDGLLDEFVTHVIHPEDSIAVAETRYYCDPECFVSEHGSGNQSQQEPGSDRNV